MELQAGAHAVRLGNSWTLSGDVRCQTVDPALGEVLAALLARVRIAVAVVVEFGASNEVLEDEGVRLAAHCVQQKAPPRPSTIQRRLRYSEHLCRSEKLRSKPPAGGVAEAAGGLLVVFQWRCSCAGQILPALTDKILTPPAARQNISPKSELLPRYFVLQEYFVLIKSALVPTTFTRFFSRCLLVFSQVCKRPLAGNISGGRIATATEHSLKLTCAHFTLNSMLCCGKSPYRSKPDEDTCSKIQRDDPLL